MSMKELIDNIQSHHEDLSKTTIKAIVDSTIQETVNLIREKGSFRFPKFATFTTYKRKAREGKHPRTGEPITIPESIGVRTKISSDFKQEVQSCTAVAED